MMALSEMQSRALLEKHGVPFNRALSAMSADEAVASAEAIGFPVALKGDHPAIAHKSDAGLVRLNLSTPEDVRWAAGEIQAAMPEGGRFSVQEMIAGDREFIVGLITDEVFGPCVTIGVGGVFTEALSDAVFRRLPVDEDELVAALDDLKNQKLLGALRGKPPVDRTALAHVALAVARAAEADLAIAEIDLNPVILVDGRPVAVDALVVKQEKEE